MRRFAVLLCCVAPALASAAINPAEYTRDAPYQLRLRPLTEIVHTSERDGDTHRRTTIVAEVVVEHRDVANLEVGDTVVIDWTVNVDAQQRAREAHDREYGTMPGPQFLYEPDAPTPDADGLFWANLTFDAQATIPPHLMPVPKNPPRDADHRFGEILVPASHQYTFDAPEGMPSQARSEPVSLLALIASPATYHGRQISTMGVLHVEVERTTLCIDRESAEAGARMNCTVLHEDGAYLDHDMAVAFDGQYVHVFGVLEASRPPRGYRSVIRDIDLIRPVRD